MKKLILSFIVIFLIAIAGYCFLDYKNKNKNADFIVSFVSVLSRLHGIDEGLGKMESEEGLLKFLLDTEKMHLELRESNSVWLDDENDYRREIAEMVDQAFERYLSHNNILQNLNSEDDLTAAQSEIQHAKLLIARSALKVMRREKYSEEVMKFTKKNRREILKILDQEFGDDPEYSTRYSEDSEFDPDSISRVIFAARAIRGAIENEKAQE